MPTATEKARALEAIRTLPDGATIDDQEALPSRDRARRSRLIGRRWADRYHG